jgi:septal ring factor EnvC (AmiA/AmiB activator)
MTDLTKQLEDKKKELAQENEADYLDWDKTQVLQAEIAILKQAIAEMQKQRQEILDEIRQRKKVYENEKSEVDGTWDAWFELRQVELFIEKLNQPKTEEAKHL